MWFAEEDWGKCSFQKRIVKKISFEKKIWKNVVFRRG